MDLNENEKELIEQWIMDPSFANWVNKQDANDVAYWENYFNEHTDQWELAKLAKSIIKGVPFKKVPTNPARKAKALNNLMDRLEDQNKQKNRLLVVRQIRSIAAAILFVTVLGIYHWYASTPKDVVLTTTYGEQLSTVLPDGSKVTLNANSTLSYSQDNTRKVNLKGEAYFDVVKSQGGKESFEVITDDLVVNVLGTSFNVNSRNDQTEVFLEEGEIELEIQEEDPIQMEAGDLISYSKKQQTLKDKKANASALENASWKDGALVFNQTPLEKALFEIEDIYGIQFVIQKTGLEDEVISGGVPISNLKVTLETLSEVYNLKITQEGKRYFLSK